MALVFFEVIISNCLDDSTRSEVMVFHSTDVDGINYASVMAEQFVNLNDFAEEKIIQVKRINPINAATNPDTYDIVNSIINQ